MDELMTKIKQWYAVRKDLLADLEKRNKGEVINYRFNAGKIAGLNEELRFLESLLAEVKE